MDEQRLAELERLRQACIDSYSMPFEIEPWTDPEMGPEAAAWINGFHEAAPVLFAALQQAWQERDIERVRADVMATLCHEADAREQQARRDRDDALQALDWLRQNCTNLPLGWHDPEPITAIITASNSTSGTDRCD